MKKLKILAFTLLTIPLLSGCIGSFALLSGLHEWNNNMYSDDFRGKLYRNGIFLTLLIFQVYTATFLIDWYIFNVIEFWSGSNPIAMKEGESETQYVKYMGREFNLTARKGKMTITELSGVNKGKETVLYFNGPENSITILEDGNMVKVADYVAVERNMAGLAPVSNSF